jgi:hypothetical protein
MSSRYEKKFDVLLNLMSNTFMSEMLDRYVGCQFLLQISLKCNKEAAAEVGSV